jgi:hypothetical protein
MKILKNFALVLVFILVAFLGLARSAHAATLYLSSNTDVLRIGDKLEVNIKIDSEGAGVNAVQGTLQFPKDILEATKIDKSDSVFDFWLQEPTFSNDTGRVNFVGGSTVGSVGKSLQALRVFFTVKGTGRAELTVTDAALTASNGSGTNVLSTLQGLVVNSTPKTGGAQVAVPTQIPAPTQITRPAVVASGLPSKPSVTIPLYGDPTSWFNRTDNFNAQWKLPPDVSGVETSVDQNIHYAGETSEGLFESKVFQAIPRDGVWYLHVRFKNNIGWGDVNNYRIAVDTHPPLAFQATVNEGNSTDSPAPTLKFDAKDSLSGLKEYQITIDNGDILRVPADKYTGVYKLPLLVPGKHRITVRAVDNADNSTVNDITLETLPIPSPVITFVTQDLLSDQQTGVVVKGSSLPNIDVNLTLHQKATVIARGKVRTNANGNWEFTFDGQLKNGNYNVSAQSQDARGALSLMVESPQISVQSAPVIQLGSLRIGAGGAAALLLLLLITSFGGGVWFWRKTQEKLAMRVGFAESEISKIFRLITEDIDKLSEAAKTQTLVDDEYALGRLRENIKKMESYLKKGVDRINK